jgi:hypothetical protein
MTDNFSINRKIMAQTTASNKRALQSQSFDSAIDDSRRVGNTHACILKHYCHLRFDAV